MLISLLLDENLANNVPLFIRHKRMVKVIVSRPTTLSNGRNIVPAIDELHATRTEVVNTAKLDC